MKNFLSNILGKSEPRLSVVDDDFFEQLRRIEFVRLDEHGHTYLDYTGGNLYPVSQISTHYGLLRDEVLGNPHSTNPTSQKATNLVEESRAKVIEFFNAEDYVCVFTQNATGALKIVGECYPFNEGSSFVLLSDNHNSVNGIREFCNKKGGKTTYVPVQYEDLQINEKMLGKALRDHASSEGKLFAFPAQSNVSGTKHDLKWIKKAQDLGYDVLLDAAAFVPTSKLDLKVVQPEFVAVSFYKIFGYPTGLGCLLIKKTVFDKLQKPWFAGGTVTLVSVAGQHRFLAKTYERFEDGTINYLDIPAIKTGLEFIENIGIDRVNSRVRSLIETLSTELKELKHDNGQALVKVFGPENFSNRGGNIILNFFDVEGRVFAFEDIEFLANKDKISIRSGCFCNPGLDEINNCLSNDEIATYFMSRDEGDYHDMIAYLGKMRGATRVSVGIPTTQKDLIKFLDFAGSLRNKHVGGSTESMTG